MVNTFLKILSVLVSFCTLSSIKLEASNESLNLFYKCYGHITGLRPKNDHPLLLSVQSGTKSAVDACIETFENATLNTSTGITIAETEGNPDRTLEAYSILRNFQAFHRTWFKKDDFRSSLGTDFVTHDIDIHDPSEAANHVSWILFSENEPYRNLLRGIRSIRAIREMTPEDKGPSTNVPRFHLRHDFLNPVEPCPPGLNHHRSSPFGDATNDPRCGSAWNPSFLEVGQLRGLRPLSESEMALRVVAAVNLDNFSETVTMEYLKPKGAGVLGTFSFNMLNSGMGTHVSNGGDRVPRRLLNVALEEFLCRTTPVLQSMDVISTLRPSGTHPWQNNSTCMACHATIDAGAGVFRNLSLVSTAGWIFSDRDGNLRDVMHLRTHPTVNSPTNNHVPAPFLPPEADIFGISSDSNFYKRPPNGKLMMRDFKGELINQNVLGIDQLGEALSNVDDFYLCAASRYYGFFTGFTPPLLDVPTASEQEARARQEMIQLGLNLKQTQSLKELIRGILQSNFYQYGVQQ